MAGRMPLLFVFHNTFESLLLLNKSEQVAGEIPSFSVLKWGFIWGVSVVGALYLLLAGILVSFPHNLCIGK